MTALPAHRQPRGSTSTRPATGSRRQPTGRKARIESACGRHGLDKTRSFRNAVLERLRGKVAAVAHITLEAFRRRSSSNRAPGWWITPDDHLESASLVGDTDLGIPSRTPYRSEPTPATLRDRAARRGCAKKGHLRAASGVGEEGSVAADITSIRVVAGVAINVRETPPTTGRAWSRLWPGSKQSPRR